MSRCGNSHSQWDESTQPSRSLHYAAFQGKSGVAIQVCVSLKFQHNRFNKMESIGKRVASKAQSKALLLIMVGTLCSVWTPDRRKLWSGFSIHRMSPSPIRLRRIKHLLKATLLLTESLHGDKCNTGKEVILAVQRVWLCGCSESGHVLLMLWGQESVHIVRTFLMETKGKSP